MMSVTFWVLFDELVGLESVFAGAGSSYVGRGGYGGSQSEQNAQNSQDLGLHFVLKVLDAL